MELYKLVRDNLPNLKNLSYCQFVFCLYVFFEIGVLKLNTQFGYVVSLYEDNKTSLENSSLYNKMKLLQKIN